MSDPLSSNPREILRKRRLEMEKHRAADPVDRIHDICIDAEGDKLTRIAAELGYSSVETTERQRAIKRLEQVVRLNPAEFDPSVATCPCGACEHYRKLLRQQGTPLDQLGKPNAVKATVHANVDKLLLALTTCDHGVALESSCAECDALNGTPE